MGACLTITLIFSVGQFVDFYRENIKIMIKDSIVEVKGYYYLFNNNAVDIKIALGYPFPIYEDLQFPSTISIIDDIHKNKIDYKKRKKSISFPVSISALDSTIIKINYTQECLNGHFEYILTSTKLWGKPLKLAEFTIEMDNNLKLISHSYAFDSTYKEKDKIYYYFKRENFFPDENIYLGWKTK